MNADPSAPWYRDGLRFSCTQCGNCCTGAPGYVWVDADEIGRLAEALGLSVDEFGRQFVRQVGRRYSLIERPNGECIFWDKAAGCTVYDARPTQCRTWPFWEENIESKADWELVGLTCPGTDQGRFYSVEEIEAAAARTSS
jgi:Fe-S-cluster containining protein